MKIVKFEKNTYKRKDIVRITSKTVEKNPIMHWNYKFGFEYPNCSEFVRNLIIKKNY